MESLGSLALCYRMVGCFGMIAILLRASNQSDLPMAQPLLIIIGYVWPEPNSSAAGSRMLSLIRLYRQQGWQVIFASAAEKSPHRFDLSTLDVVEHSVELNHHSFDEWLADQAPQAVMFDRFMLEEQFGWRVEQACPDAMRILDMEDVHALRHAREQAVKQGRELDNGLLNSELAQREIAAIYRCDLTLVISEFEMQLLQQHFSVPAELLCYCPFLLDEPPSADLSGFKQRQHFIAIGNFRHAPNWHSVLWLKQLWPAIRKQVPQAELHIYGAYPPPKATALHNAKQGFLVKGWANDAVAVMKQARLCLAPLAFGAGLKGKLLEAMVCGTPSVTTPIGAEGMLADNNWPGAIVSTDDDFVAAAVGLYQDETRWSKAQQLGGTSVWQRFDGAKHSARIWQQLQHVQAELTAHRQANFTGLMLRHHAYRSTKFMGQWIEAKTKLKQLTIPS